MDDMKHLLGKLSKTVSEVSHRLEDPAALEAARRRWLQSPPARVRVTPARRLLLLAAAACLACVAVLFVVRRPATRVSFAVGSPAVHGTVGEWIAAGSAAPIPLRFSEGTSFTLEPGAKLRVTATTANGAEVLLEQGSVAASVVHTGPDTGWSLRAGPFDVHITGTRFGVAWDPTAETFELTMSEGTVVVRGPLLPSERQIAAGERLRISIREQVMELRSARLDAIPPPSAEAKAPTTPEPAVIATADVSAAPPARSAAPPSSAAVVEPSPVHEPGWRDLAKTGKYQDALAAAERAGFAQELDRASSSDLLLLADAARYASRPALAREALLAQRRRFGARGRTAFLLGKIAADQQGSSGEAIRWFEIYLSEEPGGALAEQALGRILEFRKGDPAAARPVAERYLARYPSGTYAALARSVLPP
jgi:hypothetical protein